MDPSIGTQEHDNRRAALIEVSVIQKPLVLRARAPLFPSAIWFCPSSRFDVSYIFETFSGHSCKMRKVLEEPRIRTVSSGVGGEQRVTYTQIIWSQRPRIWCVHEFVCTKFSAHFTLFTAPRLQISLQQRKVVAVDVHYPSHVFLCIIMMQLVACFPIHHNDATGRMFFYAS